MEKLRQKWKDSMALIGKSLDDHIDDMDKTKEFDKMSYEQMALAAEDYAARVLSALEQVRQALAELRAAEAAAAAASAGGGGGGGVRGSYSKGLEAGPVDFTGLAMLHGTPQNPEWVLTNKQMQNVLSGLANSANHVPQSKGDTHSSNDIYIESVIIKEAYNTNDIFNGISKIVKTRR